MACRLLEAPQPPPLALVITHETPDRFTACTGVLLCLFVCMPSQPRRAAQDGRKPCGAITYTITGRKPTEGRRGAQSVHACTTPHGNTTGGGQVCPYPGLESMVKPRSRGGQVCRRAGSRRARVAVLLSLLLLLLLLKSVFLSFCPFWAFCDFCKSPFCGF